MYKHNTNRKTFLIAILYVLVTFISAIFICQAADNQSTKLQEKIISKEAAKSVELNILEKLQSLPGAIIKQIEPKPPFKEMYQINLIQPLNHHNPQGEKFVQRIFVSHIDVQKPVVYDTEGYAFVDYFTKDLSTILGANHILVEHRYFGQSIPEKLKWEFLTIKQAADDHHRILTLLKKIYTGKWVSTGFSKGGQAALIHRRYYPDDVLATVAFDAPICFALEDPRIDQFFEKIGDEECRARLKKFQRLLLQNRDQILPLFKQYAKEKKYKYSIGFDVAFEYATMEYIFSFWQYEKNDCNLVPQEGSSPEEMFNHLKKIVSLRWYNDAMIKYLEPHFYQTSTELGYYGYITAHLKDLLISVPNPTNTFFAPKNVPCKYKPKVMQDIQQWLKNEGNNIIYTYGEADPWSAPAIQLSGKTNALKIVKKGGTHMTFILDLPEKEQELIISTLEKWLDIEIERKSYKKK